MSNGLQPLPGGSKSPFVTRRQFILGGMACLAAAWAGTLVQHQLFAQPGSAAAGPVTFPLAELPVGGSRALTYNGYPALVLRTSESLRCFSLICTHLGCTVAWQAGKDEFYCPCHDGRFDRFGEVLAGPPPLPMEQIPVRVEGETVIVGEEA
jgi:nitrite reductase/ring-hydroxylating ferredoxin subunit